MEPSHLVMHTNTLSHRRGLEKGKKLTADIPANGEGRRHSVLGSLLTWTGQQFNTSVGCHGDIQVYLIIV